MQCDRFLIGKFAIRLDFINSHMRLSFLLFFVNFKLICKHDIPTPRCVFFCPPSSTVEGSWCWVVFRPTVAMRRRTYWRECWAGLSRGHPWTQGMGFKGQDPGTQGSSKGTGGKKKESRERNSALGEVPEGG